MNENLRYKTLQINAYSIVKQINQHRLVVYPDFKDRKPWNSIRKSRYIESIILGIPSQPIWCEETPIGSHLIIDGSQRIEALYEFLNEQFSLTNLKIRREYNTLSLRELPYHEIVNIEDRYQIPFIVINYDTQADLKCEFYARLFESEKSYKSQAARNFGYREALPFLKRLQESAFPYIRFQSSFRRYGADTFESKIDEIFLHLILFTSFPDHAQYLPSTLTIEDLLDSLMARLQHQDPETLQWQARILFRLENITEDDNPLQITLTHTIINSGINVLQFYKKFLNLHENPVHRRFEITFDRAIQPTMVASALSKIIFDSSKYIE